MPVLGASAVLLALVLGAGLLTLAGCLPEGTAPSDRRYAAMPLTCARSADLARDAIAAFAGPLHDPRQAPIEQSWREDNYYDENSGFPILSCRWEYRADAVGVEPGGPILRTVYLKFERYRNAATATGRIDHWADSALHRSATAHRLPEIGDGGYVSDRPSGPTGTADLTFRSSNLLVGVHVGEENKGAPAPEWQHRRTGAGAIARAVAAGLQQR
ncbi:hypothetical protein AB0H76_03995 [Nocardia sp. NPDC050712]|uniref:hypothetical protein n=1 Tax=Nocardia sp. NPDC050712 TaxID=3155518 RepID=UPI0033C6C91B